MRIWVVPCAQLPGAAGKATYLQLAPLHVSWPTPLMRADMGTGSLPWGFEGDRYTLLSSAEVLWYLQGAGTGVREGCWQMQSSQGWAQRGGMR